MPDRATPSTGPTTDRADPTDPVDPTDSADPTSEPADRPDARRAGPGAERVGRRDHLVGLSWSVGVAAAWVALAAWRPTTTFHLAPVLVAAAWPVGLRRGAVVRVASRDAGAGAAAAAVLAVAAALLLDVADQLRGPTLWGPGSVWFEIVPAIAVGAWGGRRYARCGAPGG